MIGYCCISDNYCQHEYGKTTYIPVDALGSHFNSSLEYGFRYPTNCIMSLTKLQFHIISRNHSLEDWAYLIFLLIPTVPQGLTRISSSTVKKTLWRSRVTGLDNMVCLIPDHQNNKAHYNYNLMRWAGILTIFFRGTP